MKNNGMLKKCKECGKETEPEELCPKCQIHLMLGYGLAFGGMGPYKLCPMCNYVKKDYDDGSNT